MRTKFSKLLSILLCLVMALTLLPTVALAEGSGYRDTDGHWAETAIDRWSAYGVLEGDSGNFNPDGALTRAQMAAILSRLLNLPDAPDAGFSDVKPDDWFAEYINKCAAAGIMLGDNGKANPNEPITRQQAIVMIARALGIQPIENPDLTKYADAAQVSAYAQGYVAALIEAGIVGGVTADLLAPQANINRASTVTIFDRAIGTYANEAGQTIKADGDGLILIVAKDVKLTDVPEGTRIVVADGATGLTVNGKAVSDDQTYIVPETTTDTPSGGSSHTHSYTTEKVTKEPTCTEAGVKTLTCSCGASYTKAIPATGVHTYVYTPDDNDTTHTGTCSVCGTTTSAAAHDESGTDKACSICGYQKYAAKIGENYHVELADAITAAEPGTPVTILKDITLSSTLDVSKNVTLDLNGHNIHGELVRAIKVCEGTLTLTGSGIVSSNVADVANSVIRVGGDAEANAGLVVGKDVTISTATAYGVAAFGTTTETVEINGTVTSTAPANNAYDGCAVSTVGSDSTAASITINDGAVISATNTNAIYMPSGNLTVNGGTITGRTGIYVKSGSTTVNGGTITGNGAAVEYNYYGNGGISTGDALVVDSCGYPRGVPSVSVTGGSFASTNAKAVASYNTEGNEAVTKFVSGGTFSTDPTEYVAEGKMANRDGGGMYVVVNDTRVKTEEQLKAAVEAGGEVILGADITLTAPLNITKDVTLNLGEYTITGKERRSAIVLTCDTGVVKAAVNATSGGVRGCGSNGNCFEMPWNNKGTVELTVNGGSYESQRNYFVNINADSSTVDTRKDKLFINGGTYSGKKIINANPANTEIVMTGGILTGTDGGIVFGTNSSNAKFTMSGGAITCQNATVITAQASGNTIDINGNANVTGKLSLKNCTMNIKGGNVNITGSSNDNRAIMVSSGTTLNISGDAKVKGEPLFNMNGGTVSITGGKFTGKIVNGLNYGNSYLQSVSNLLTAQYQLSTMDADGWYQVLPKD